MCAVETGDIEVCCCCGLGEVCRGDERCGARQGAWATAPCQLHLCSLWIDERLSRWRDNTSIPHLNTSAIFHSLLWFYLITKDSRLCSPCVVFSLIQIIMMSLVACYRLTFYANEYLDIFSYSFIVFQYWILTFMSLLFKHVLKLFHAGFMCFVLSIF